MMDVLTVASSEYGLITLLILMLVAMAAGYIDTLVGGGGLITIPALLLAGVPPVAALGTNKMQGCAGTATASITLWSKGKLDLRAALPAMLLAFLGALAGAIIVQYVDAKALELIIPAVIICIVVYFLIAPNLNVSKPKAKLSQAKYNLTAVPAIGVYDGMFGPATGSFFVLAGVGLRGMDIIGASVVAKTLNFSTNVAALCIFLWYGQVVLWVGLAMVLGQVIGARLGAGALLKIDPNTLRYLVVAMCLVMLVVWILNR